MSTSQEIILLGDNLGQRHRYLNILVLEAASKGTNFHDLPEKFPVDRLFKIDLATKLKNVDYIIKTLKDDDMLYVSRALKSKWLLEFQDIINPKYLEDTLFPEMVMPAITRMKHWLYINLRDPSMCQEFYCHYKENAFEFAIKFLSHCSNKFIINEVPLIVTKMSAQHLKVLSEKCPTVAKIYYDSLGTNEAVVNNYLKQEQTYFNSVKSVLKTDADVFLDITEKYFNINMFVRLSSVATNYIMSHHKHRVLNKLELYVAYILHIPTVAARLSEEECKETVVKLAQAKYLQGWFKYKVVEPLIKRLTPDKRAAFKKQIFVDKDIGVLVEEWPYQLPAPPIEVYNKSHVFDEQSFMPLYENKKYIEGYGMRSMACSMSRKYGSFQNDFCMKLKTVLDRLFDEFRFVSFDRTFQELGERLKVTASAERRRDMFLVLVSKSGGRNDALTALLRIAMRHLNEPAHNRAAIVRSLVKRANVWRVPLDIWQLLLEFGHDLGLDGTVGEAGCREGFHAVVIRQLLSGGCEPAISKAFLNDFSTLSEYSLSKEEQTCVVAGLQNILMAATIDANPIQEASYIQLLLKVCKDYDIRIKSSSPIVDAVKSLSLRDLKLARPLLQNLYDAKIARRELFQINLEFKHDEPALLNALRHGPKALGLERAVDILVNGGSQYDRFLSKLVIYFDQNEFVKPICNALKDKIAEAKDVKLIRPLTYVLGQNLEIELNNLNADKDRVRFASALKACAHLARPKMNLADWGWHKAGVKSVATRAMRCREIEKVGYIKQLAAERRTVRVALALSMRSYDIELLYDTFTTASKVRPLAALHVGLIYFHRYGAKIDKRVCDIIKNLILNVDLSSCEYLRKRLRETQFVPPTIKADYCASVYLAIYKISDSNARYMLVELSELVPEVSNELMETILIRMLENTDKGYVPVCFPALYVRYLMLSKDDKEVTRRFEIIGNKFLQQMDDLRSKKDSQFQDRLNQTIDSLQYNAAFFDHKYTGCLLVIEKFLTWLQTFMPKEEHFQTYVRIHLIMLYLKAVRQTIKQVPVVDSKKLEVVKAVGFVFGRYIAKEAAELVSSYFDSVIELYSYGLIDYFGELFLYSNTKFEFLAAVLRGMLGEGVGCQKRLAVYLLCKFEYDIDTKMKDEIKENIIKDNDLKFFFHVLCK